MNKPTRKAKLYKFSRTSTIWGMTVYQLQKQDRAEILDSIANLVPQRYRNRIRKSADEIADLFEGQDINALGVLYRAAEKDCFQEFADKLRKYYEKEGKTVPVEQRSIPVGQPIDLLRSLLERMGGIRGIQSNPNLPPQLRKLVDCPQAIRMEIFFADCYREITP